MTIPYQSSSVIQWRRGVVSLLLARLCLCLFFIGSMWAQPPDEVVPLPLKLIPERIEIGMNYGGAPLRIEGTVAEGSDVVVVIRGPEDEQEFNKKVRAGPIWISSGKVSISGVPSLFLSLSSGSVRGLVDSEVVDARVLDPEAIKHEMAVDAGGDVVDEELMKDNYLALKEEEGKYQVLDSAVELGSPSNSVVSYSIDLDWPRTAQPAVYEVTAYEIRDRRVTGTGEAELNVVKVGLPESIHAFALDKSVQYGALAVLLAVIAGFGIDFLTSRIFGSRPAAH